MCWPRYAALLMLSTNAWAAGEYVIAGGVQADSADGIAGVLLGDVSGDVDQVVVDGAVHVTADIAQGAGAAVSAAQSGRIRNYLAGAVGVTAVVVCAVLLWLWV